MYCNNMYNNYDNDLFNYYTTSTFDNRTKEYLISRYEPNAYWDYGDTVNIIFNIIECTELTLADIESLEGKFLRVNFYNNRYELIPFTYEIDGISQFSVYLDYNISTKYFKRGTYHCSIDVLTYVDEEKTEISTSETILPMVKCSFYVQ